MKHRRIVLVSILVGLVLSVVLTLCLLVFFAGVLPLTPGLGTRRCPLKVRRIYNDFLTRIIKGEPWSAEVWNPTSTTFRNVRLVCDSDLLFDKRGGGIRMKPSRNGPRRRKEIIIERCAPGERRRLDWENDCSWNEYNTLVISASGFRHSRYPIAFGNTMPIRPEEYDGEVLSR